MSYRERELHRQEVCVAGVDTGLKLTESRGGRSHDILESSSTTQVKWQDAGWQYFKLYLADDILFLRVELPSILTLQLTSFSCLVYFECLNVYNDVLTVKSLSGKYVSLLTMSCFSIINNRCLVSVLTFNWPTQLSRVNVKKWNQIKCFQRLTWHHHNIVGSWDWLNNRTDV